MNGTTNREYWDSRGIKSTIDENLDPVTGNPITVLTLKMDGLEINNGSQIRCYSAVVMVDISAPASLVIAGEYRSGELVVGRVHVVYTIAFHVPYMYIVI